MAMSDNERSEMELIIGCSVLVPHARPQRSEGVHE
jgi:hypothetical protein